MNKPRCFMLALCAMQTNPEWRPVPGAEPGRIHTVGSSADMPPSLSLWPIGLIAQSEKEARGHAVQLNLETRPPGEGGSTTAWRSTRSRRRWLSGWRGT
jgi:hypothetical protein